jgi:membrane protease YdiL (CAAX protease family)
VLEYALIAALVVLAAAITIWVFVPAMRGPEAARRDIGTHRLAFGAIVAMLTLNGLLTLPIASLIRDGGLTITTFALAALSTQVPMLLVIYLRLILPRAVTWRELGLRPLPIERIVRVGLATGVGGLVLTITVSMLLSQVGLRPNQFEQFEFVRTADAIGLAVVLVLAAVTGPFTEELFFRGFLFGLYRRRQPLWLAYIVAGLLFAGAHVMPNRMNPAQMAGLATGIFVLGTLLAWTYQRTGSLYPGMLAHAVNNATGLLALYAVQSR